MRSLPAVPCSRIRHLRNAVQVGVGRGRTFDFHIREPGVYRIEGWLLLDGEERAWVLSKPIDVR